MSSQAATAVPLASLTTMRVGGPASRLVTATTSEELIEAARSTDAAGEPLLVVGGGSNLVIADAGFEGTVVHVATDGVRVESADACGGAVVHVAAGQSWDGFVERAVAEGWSGVEALSGIPGSAGATPVQNVGAYGQEIAQTLFSVRTWDRAEGRIRTFAAADCGFGYRSSRFKADRLGTAGRYVVLDVTFQLRLADRSEPIRYADLATGLGVAVGDRVPLIDARAAVLEQRRRRGMVLDPADHDTWSCGSFFTNPLLDLDEVARLQQAVAVRLGPDVAAPVYPAEGGLVKTSAAWLIERAGFPKGYGGPGPASLSTKHTLALTNRGNATAADVVALARQVRDGVAEAFGVVLVNEPELVGLSL